MCCVCGDVLCYSCSLFTDKEELAEDEALLDEVVNKQVFLFLREAVIGSSGFHQEEYFVQRFHWLVTTFITLMPLKVRYITSIWQCTCVDMVANFFPNVLISLQHMLIGKTQVHKSPPIVA